jgi:hypothetical protein
MNEANFCLNCKEYIIGNFCFKCQTYINDQREKTDMPDFLKELFGGNKNEGK